MNLRRMNGSSDSHAAAIASLKIRHIAALLEIIRGVTLRHVDFVRARYAGQSTHFDDTLLFLTSIGWILENDGQLTVNDDLVLSELNVAGSAGLGKAVLTTIAGSPNPYRSQLAVYLNGFAAIDLDIVRKRTAEQSLEQISIRNLLMDSQAVTHRAVDDCYILRRDCADLFLWAKNIVGPTTTSAAIISATRRQEIGFNAELAVLRYERERLGPRFVSKIEHTSESNPFACFDIKSFTISGDIASRRFVEVKAVSKDSYQFFWTSAEMEAALLLASQYFLYLLPVTYGGTFDMDNLLVIENAYETVRLDRARWEIDENVVVCRRRGDSAIVLT